MKMSSLLQGLQLLAPYHKTVGLDIDPYYDMLRTTDLFLAVGVLEDLPVEVRVALKNLGWEEHYPYWTLQNERDWS